MNWANCKLSEFCDIVMGQSPPSSSYNVKGDGLPFFQGKTEFGKLYPQIKKYCNKPKKIAEKNDTLLSVRAPVGPTNIAPKKSCIGRGLAAIRAFNSVDYKFIFYLLRSKQIYLLGQGTGTTFKAITKDFLFDMDIAVSSIPEQTQVVSLIDQLFSDLDNAIDNLKKAKDQLKVYRQSVLKYAFEGKLSKAIFKKILIKDIALSVTYGTSKKAERTGAIPVLRMGNLNEGKIDYTDLKFYQNLNDIENLILEPGDLLFNRTNSAELVGKTSVFKRSLQYKQIVYASYLIRIRVDKNRVVPAYLNYWMNSPEALLIRNRLKSQQVGQANINGTKLKNIEFPLVRDLETQQKIVSEIESRFSVCDKMEETIENSLTKAEALRQSILKQAFEGKLTEEWRKEHPELISGENSAKALLEKIKEEREVLKNTGKRKK